MSDEHTCIQLEKIAVLSNKAETIHDWVESIDKDFKMLQKDIFDKIETVRSEAEKRYNRLILAVVTLTISILGGVVTLVVTNAAK